MVIAEKYVTFDAKHGFALPENQVKDPVACERGGGLTRRIKSWQHKAFGTARTPNTPISRCISLKKARAAHHNFSQVEQTVPASLTQVSPPM